MPNGNYQYVVSSTWNPLSMQEMLTPFTMYKEAYDKAEQEYIDRQDKIDKYSFLNDYDDSSTAKQLYQGYVNEYNKSFDDFSKNGLSQGNRRSWLNVRRRYQKNIGRLEDANAAMQEELKRRQTLDANDPTRIYAQDTTNLNIDDFLDRKRPNDYSVSGSDLYKRGAEIGASASSRIYSDPRVKDLTKYYQDFVQTVGYSPELLAEFSQRLDAIPEFQRAVESTLKEYGVTGNLTGNSYQRARQSVVNGIINGSVYKRTDSPQQNLGVLTAAQEAQNARALDSLNLQAAGAGMKKVGNQWVYDPNIDPSLRKATEVAKIKAGSGGGGGKGGSTTHNTISKQATKIEWNGNDPASSQDEEDDYSISNYSLGSSGETTEHAGKLTNYDALPDYAKRKVRQIIRDGNFDYYDIYFQPFQSGTFNDTEASLEVVPRNIVSDDKDDVDASIYSQVGD